MSDLKVTAYKKGEGFSSSGYITIDAKGFSSEDWQNVWENIKPLMDDYFDPEKNVDFFKKEIGRTIKKKKPDYLEKQAQQRLFSAWNNMNSEYYLYDLEYMQKGDFEAAVNRLQASIDLDSTMYETYYNLGIAATNAKKYDVAIDFNGYSNETALALINCDAEKKVMWIHSDLEQRRKFDFKYRLLFQLTFLFTAS